MALPSLGLYSVSNPIEKAQSYMGSAASSFAAMDKDREVEEPKKTAGGAIFGGIGGAAAGFAVGGPIGAGVGAGLGALAYYLS
jgi:hypothetical protein